MRPPADAGKRETFKALRPVRARHTRKVLTRRATAAKKRYDIKRIEGEKDRLRPC